MQELKNTKTYKQFVKISPFIVYTALNVLLLLMFYFIITNVINPLPLVVEEKVELIDNDSIVSRAFIYEDVEFSEEALVDYIKNINIKFPDIVLAQAKLESSNFNSDLFIKHNNMFGMKIANNRPTLGVKNDTTPYSTYSNWRSSVIDYALYQSRYLKQYNTKEKYLNRLGEVYAEDPNYVTKLKNIMN